MGLFRRKKNIAAQPVNVAMGDELIAVLGAAAAASGTDEHIAAIVAALAAYEDDAAAGSLYIKKIDRAAGAIPAWGVMGNREQIETRKF
jgi:hypothetical protein